MILGNSSFRYVRPEPFVSFINYPIINDKQQSLLLRRTRHRRLSPP